MTNIDIVRKHVLLLIDAGHSKRTVGEAAGIPEATIENILRVNLRLERVTPRTFKAVTSVAVRPPWETPGVVLHPRSKIPGTGTVRRVQALVRMGYSLAEIAKETGMSNGRLRLMVKPPVPLVEVRTAEKVKRYYRAALLRTPGGPYRERTKRWAEKNGWLPPGMWDDIDRDPWPVREGDLGVLIDYVEENPGLTATAIRRQVTVDLGMPVGLANRLVKEALDTEKIVKLRRHRVVRVYVPDRKEGDRNGEHKVREAAVS